MTEAATSAAAAAARANSSRQSTLSRADGPRFSLYPQDSPSTTRASSIRFAVPLRQPDLGAIQEDEFRSSHKMHAERQPYNLRRHSYGIPPQRPTLSVARSSSAIPGRRGSQTYLRRTQSFCVPGERGYEDLPVRLEEKQGFLPASSRAGNTTIPTLLRTLRDPDALGTTRVATHRWRFPFSLRPRYLFDDAKRLGRRLSQKFGFGGSRHSTSRFNPQPNRYEGVHYGYNPYPAAGELSVTEGSLYADTVVHNRVWDNQSFVTTLDNQGSDYFIRAPIQDIHGRSALGSVLSSITESSPVSSHIPVRIANESNISPEKQGGLGPFQQPTDLDGVEARRVYSALMKSLSKRFSPEAPAQIAIPEEISIEEPLSAQLSDENTRPGKSIADSSSVSRRPLSEIVPRQALHVTIEDEDEEDEEAEQLPKSNTVKRISSDDALFNQIAHPQQVWRDDSGDRHIAEATLKALTQLNISMPHVQQDEVLQPQDQRMASAADALALTPTDSTYRRSSENWRDMKTKERHDSDGNQVYNKKQDLQTLDPAFL